MIALVFSYEVRDAAEFERVYGATTVRESVRTRDHSELALRAFGAELTRTLDSVTISGPQKLHGIDAFVPDKISPG